jgi:predicted aldo/keto reductase-like oxidoreductase
MDRIILGDNQFFGVSHMSEEKGMARAQRFQNTNAIIEILDAAYEAGIHAFTFSTHESVQELCNHFRANPQKYADLRLYPVLPYAQKYAHLVNEKGILGAIREVVISDSTAGQVASMMARGGAAVLKQDPTQVMKLLIDAEMKMFRDLTVEVVFLQNNVADLLLGLGIEEIFAEFVRYVEQKYETRAGFMTLNMPRMVAFLQRCGIDDPIVCFAMNKVGFQMNPDIASYERTLRTDSFQAMAMSIMAAGAVPPREAVEYVAAFKNIRSILFGASTKAHVESTKAIIEELNRSAGENLSYGR